MPLYIAANDPGVYNVDLGYNNAGNWYNYTRNPWPSGAYEVFARVAGGQGAGSEDLNIVTSGYVTATQTTNRLGEFDIPNANLYNSPQGTDWGHYYWVPLTDADGNLVPVNVPSGQQTLQLLSSPIAGENVISFLFVPFPGAGAPPTVGNITPANGAAFAAAAAGFSFTAEGASGSTVNNDGIRVTRNGAGIMAVNVETAPFPGFPTDLQAQLMALMTRAEGNSRITETIFENRFMHVQELARFGARIHLDGETATIDGIATLRGAPVMATDLRASVSLVIAGLAAEGETMVNRVYHLDRGFERLEEKLSACGASIERISD